jgi:hypothetical protein
LADPPILPSVPPEYYKKLTYQDTQSNFGLPRNFACVGPTTSNEIDPCEEQTFTSCSGQEFVDACVLEVTDTTVRRETGSPSSEVTIFNYVDDYIDPQTGECTFIRTPDSQNGTVFTPVIDPDCGNDAFRTGLGYGSNPITTEEGSTSFVVESNTEKILSYRESTTTSEDTTTITSQTKRIFQGNRTICTQQEVFTESISNYERKLWIGSQILSEKDTEADAIVRDGPAEEINFPLQTANALQSIYTERTGRNFLFQTSNFAFLMKNLVPGKSYSWEVPVSSGVAIEGESINYQPDTPESGSFTASDRFEIINGTLNVPVSEFKENNFQLDPSLYDPEPEEVITPSKELDNDRGMAYRLEVIGSYVEQN